MNQQNRKPPAVAVVTGGGRGIGAATAEVLAGAGLSIALVARTRHQVEEVAARITANGGTALALPVDATDERAVAHAAATVAGALGPVDVLVNAAGGRFTENIGPLWHSPAETWWDEVALNLRSAFLFTHAVLPSMVDRRTGCIVNIGSYFAYHPGRYRSAYSAAKAALHTMTEVLASEIAEHGLTAFTVDPAMVKTATLLTSSHSEQAARWTPEATDLPEGEYTPATDVGELVLRLAHGAADTMSGRVVRVHSDLAAMVERADEITHDGHYLLRMTKAPGLVEADPSDRFR